MDKRHKKRAGKSAGLSYLEMVIAIAVWVLVAVAVGVIFNSTLSVFRKTSDKSEAVQQAQLATVWINRDVQDSLSLINKTATQIGLVGSDHNYIVYSWDPANQTINRKVCNDPAYLLAQGITQFSLKYYDINNQEIADPVNNAAALKNIELDLTAVKNNSAFKFNAVSKFELNPEYYWARAFDGQSPRNIISTTDNKFLIAGLTFSAGGYGSGDIALTKVDAEGKREWAKVCGSVNNEQVYGVAALSDGYAVAGIIPNINQDFFLAKISSTGTLQWSYIYEVTTTSGSYVGVSGFCADSSGFVVLVHDMLSNYLHVVKLNADGSVDSAKCKTFKQGLIAKGVAKISDGYIIAGNILSSESSWNKNYNEFFLMKIDGSTGNKVWFKTYGNGSTAIDATTFKAVTGATDEYLIAGIYSSGGNNDIILMKIDAAGDNLLLVKSYSTPTHDNVNDIERAADGYLLAGDRSEPGVSGYSDALIIKINDTGGKQWAGLIAGQWDQLGQDIQLTPEGDSLALVYGPWISGGGATDTLLARISKQGEMECCSLIADNTANVTEGSPSGYSMTPITTFPNQENFTPTSASGGYAIKDITQPEQFLCPAP